MYSTKVAGLTVALAAVVALLLVSPVAACNSAGTSNNCATCLSGYFGATCEACTCDPSGGACSDGTSGDGKCWACYASRFGENCENRCTCKFGICNNDTSSTGGGCKSCYSEFFRGTDCDSCVAGRFGGGCVNECTCKNGVCNEGLLGDGLCVSGSCQAGWYGTNCDLDTPTPPPTTAAPPTPVPPTTPEPTLPPPLETNDTDATNATDAPAAIVIPTPAPNAEAAAAGAVDMQFQRLADPAEPATVASALAVLLDMSADLIWAQNMNTSSTYITIRVTFLVADRSEHFIALDAVLRSGPPSLRALGLRSVGYIPAANFNTTAPAPVTPQPVVLPAKKVEEESIPDYGLALIGITCVIAFVACLFGLYKLWIRREVRKAQKKQVSHQVHMGRSTFMDDVKSPVERQEGNFSELPAASFAPAEKEMVSLPPALRGAQAKYATQGEVDIDLEMGGAPPPQGELMPPGGAPATVANAKRVEIGTAEYLQDEPAHGNELRDITAAGRPAGKGILKRKQKPPPLEAPGGHSNGNGGAKLPPPLPPPPAPGTLGVSAQDNVPSLGNSTQPPQSISSSVSQGRPGGPLPSSRRQSNPDEGMYTPPGGSEDDEDAMDVELDMPEALVRPQATGPPPMTRRPPTVSVERDSDEDSEA